MTYKQRFEKLQSRARVLENALKWVVKDWDNGELDESTIATI